MAFNNPEVEVEEEGEVGRDTSTTTSKVGGEDGVPYRRDMIGQ